MESSWITVVCGVCFNEDNYYLLKWNNAALFYNHPGLWNCSYIIDKYAAIVTIRLCFSQPVNRDLYARLQVNFGTVKVIILLVKWSSERNMYTFIWLIVLANSCNFSYKSQCMWLNLIMKYVYLEVRKIITSFSDPPQNNCEWGCYEVFCYMCMRYVLSVAWGEVFIKSLWGDLR